MDKISFFSASSGHSIDKTRQPSERANGAVCSIGGGYSTNSEQARGAGKNTPATEKMPAAQEKNLPAFIKKYTPLMNKMVFLLIRKHQNLASYKDDIADAALRGVVKAAQTYDERRGSLTNYVVNCIRNETYTFLRWYNRYSPRVVPIDVAFPADRADIGVFDCESGYDRVPDPQDVEETILNKIIVDRISRIASTHGEQYAQVFRLLAAGMNQNEIASELGVTRQRVSKIVDNIRRRYIKKYGDEA